MHSIYEMKFRRRFSINPYKSLRMKLGEMSCQKNWVDDKRGAPYPVVESNEREGAMLSESLRGARYCVDNKNNSMLCKARLLGQHFPYATYEITIDHMTADERSGMGVRIMASGEEGSDYTAADEPCLKILAKRSGRSVKIVKRISVGGVELPVEEVNSGIDYEANMALIVTARGRFFDVYLKTGLKIHTVCTFDVQEMNKILKYNVFVRSTAALLVELEAGAAVQGGAEFFLEGGVSHADMKCMRYENGMPIMSDGKLFMTLSSRLAAGNFHSVVSWNPSTAELKMEGAMFFDYGDGAWCSDISSSTVYNRKTGEWYVWAAAFSHGHICCHATSLADLRYGINVLDAKTMPVEKLEEMPGEESLATTCGGSVIGKATLTDDRLFFGKHGDEDPDLMFDEKRGKWLLGICRVVTDPDGHDRYRYFLFESDDPFEGYTFVDCTTTGENTGGSIIRVGGELYLLCGTGSGRNGRGMYQLHPLSDLSKCTLMKFDFDDGGWRGWGQLIPVPCGNRTRYVWMTFDRHNGSDYNWSYGNIHVFESDLMNMGWEWNEKPCAVQLP